MVPPAISSQPQNLTILNGSNAAFSVTVSGSPPLSFRWQKDGANLVDSGPFSGTASNTLTLTGAFTNDTGNYRVSVSNVVGSATSDVATLTVLVPPTITSATNATGRQGAPFSYAITATGTAPITFGAGGLPAGLGVNQTNGLISGIPAVAGAFSVLLFATNPGLTATGQLYITLTTGVPGITSSLAASGKQGQNFNYTIRASNSPVSFSASGLPAGLSLNPVTGVISGPPVPSGSFPVTIGAANQYGSDSRVLTLTVASSVPVITSPLTATWTENQTGFSYNITATDSPTTFGASGLPLGLTLNTNTGAITGTPLYGGMFNMLIWAVNAWGTGSATLALNLNYATLTGLDITGVTNVFSTPYLLDFSFSLRDNTDPALSSAVVRPVSDLQVVCMEDGQPIPSETALIVERANKKQLKLFLGLDYTYSMFASPGAIDAMQAAAKTLIYAEPPHAQFGIYEFHAEYVDPQLVTGFTSDKAALSQAIDGIQANYVQGNYAGTRCWDAIYAALGRFGPFTQSNRDEARYLVVMSDGNDDSSLLNTNPAPLDVLVSLAQSNQVRIYCVAFGPNINTNALGQLTSQTLGRYYEAATTADLDVQFAKIARDIDGQYLLRWATMRRAPQPFQPSFQITVDGMTATYSGSPPYNPTNYAGDVRVGALRLVADADIGPQTIRFRASYVPRYIRAIRVNYRANYPCVSSLSSTGPGEILSGWSMTETNDGVGGKWLTIVSPNPSNLLTSIAYGAMGELATFHFQYPDLVTAQQAFTVFTVDNSIYTNMLPNGQSFVLENGTSFVTTYPPTPPHGTPVPWLFYYGFTNNLAAAELSDPNGNGFAVWQDYLAGLNPRDPNSRFSVRMAGVPRAGQPPRIAFTTVVGRTYRVETATSVDSWTILRDNISGTGGEVSLADTRNLSGATAVFYRVSVR